MNDVIQAAAELQTVCQSQNWQFCFIGGLALQRWSEPRETVDVDLSLFAGFGDEQQFSDVLLKHFAPRISDAADFARERRVLLLRSTRGVGLDVAPRKGFKHNQVFGRTCSQRYVDRIGSMWNGRLCAKLESSTGITSASNSNH